MTSYRKAIEGAIKAAGFQVEEFEVTSTGFEPDWTAAGLGGRAVTLDDQPAIRKQNRKLQKVVKALTDAGYRATVNSMAFGGKFCEVNEYKHYGHTVDYSDKASVHHY